MTSIQYTFRFLNFQLIAQKAGYFQLLFMFRKECECANKQTKIITSAIVVNPW